MPKIIDLVGQTFDQLRVIEYIGQQAKPRATLFRAVCACGREALRTSVYLRHAARQSCRACAVQRLRESGRGNVARMTDEAGRCTLCKRSMTYPKNVRLWARRGAMCKRCTRKLQRLGNED